jgi:hypothetical protein
MRDPPQQHDRAVAFTAFELREVPLRHLGVLRQRLARHAALAAQPAHPLPQPVEVAAGFAGRRRILAGGFYGHRLICIIVPYKYVGNARVKQASCLIAKRRIV